MAQGMGDDMKENMYRQLANDLFDVIEKYADKFTTSEFIGFLELHKQQMIWDHFNEIKDEMIKETND